MSVSKSATVEPTKQFEEIARLAEIIRQTKSPLAISGGSSRDYIGEVVAGATKLSTSGLTGVLAYEPDELFITVATGTKLATVEETLAANNQRLSFEPPSPAGATIGGAVATGFSGPARPTGGRLRDHLLGCKLIDGGGDVLNFGGRLIKNVAGFDISRLMAGSFGTLGCLVEVTLRVSGDYETELTLQQQCSAKESLLIANNVVARGLPIVASSWQTGNLRIRLCGSKTTIAKAATELASTKKNPDLQYWSKLRNWDLDCFHKSNTVWLCYLPATAELKCDELGLIEWHGCRRWFFDEAPENLREQVAAVGGSTILIKRGERFIDQPVFDQPAKPLVGLQKRIKKVFDPNNIFNPGKLSFL